MKNIFKIKNDCWRKHRKKICSSHEAIKLIRSSINKSDELSGYYIQQGYNFPSLPYSKEEIKNIIRPVLALIIQEIYPYIYISVIFIFISLE